MASPLDAECLLVAIGVHNVLAGEPSLHKYQIEKAAMLPKECRKVLLRFLSTDAFEPAEDYRSIDYDELKKQLSHGPTPEQQAALAAAVPDPELAQAMGDEVSRIQQWANGVFPRETRDTVRGPVDEEPSAAALGDFARLWEVVCDPMVILRDLSEGCLSDDQAAAVAQVWPNIYGIMRQASADAIAATTKRGEPTMRKQAQIRVLRQEPDFDPELAAAIQATYAASQQGQQQPPRPHAPSGPGGQDPDLTPGQRAAGG